MALGMIEVFGFTTAIKVADLMAKTANIEVVALDSNKPAAGDDAEVPLIMIVKIEGKVSDVEQAVAVGVEEAEKRDLYVTSYVISRQDDETEKLAHRCSVGRDKMNKPAASSVK